MSSTISAGTVLASRLGYDTSVAPLNPQKASSLTNYSGSVLQKDINQVDASLQGKSYLLVKDSIGDWSNSVAMVQIASSELDGISDYLTKIQSKYTEFTAMSMGSAEYESKYSEISNLQTDLSTFIGKRALSTTDITLMSPTDGTLDPTFFSTIQVSPNAPSDPLAVLEVDMGKVLTSKHSAASCPICQAQSQGLFANMGIEVGNAPATNVTNVTGATTIGNSNTSYIEPLRKGYTWDLSNGETLSYSFYTGSVNYDNTAYSSVTYNAPLGISTISAGNQTFLDAAFSAWDSVVKFAFEKVTESGNTVGELRAAYTTNTYAAAGSAAYAYYPNSSILGGDIWFVSNEATNSDFTPGTYGYLTALHEIGHALGLSHPFDGGSATGATLPAATDIQRNTVMTYTQTDRNMYFSRNGAGVQAKYFYAITPGIYDVAAMEYMYGADTTTNSTNTVYQWANWTADNPLIFRTVVDSGGADTFDTSNSTRKSVINLNPGSFSSIGVFTEAEQEAYWGGVLGGVIDLPSANLYTGQDNIGIAYSATIENAIGGSGNDSLTGNTANNVLKGNAGNDTIDGAAGSDTAVFSGAKAGYSITGLGTGNITVTDTDLANGDDGTDTITNTEFLEFSDVTIDTSDATGATSTATAAGGAIASATAGAAVAAAAAGGGGGGGASSSGGGGGGAGGYFAGDLSTEIGRRNFARFQASRAQAAAEERLANNNGNANPHLDSSTNSKYEPAQAARTIQIARKYVDSQRDSVAAVAKNLYESAGIFTNNLNSYSTLLDSAQAAQSSSNAIANQISTASETDKSKIANVTKVEANMLLSTSS